MNVSSVCPGISELIGPRLFVNANDDCAICQEQLILKAGKDYGATGPPYVIECGHAFHEECLKQALAQRAQCPTCRQPTNAFQQELEGRRNALQREREARRDAMRDQRAPRNDEFELELERARRRAQEAQREAQGVFGPRAMAIRRREQARQREEQRRWAQREYQRDLQELRRARRDATEENEI